MTWRRARLAALGAALLLAAAAALGWTERTALAEWWLARRVAALGLAPAALRVVSLDFGGIAVESVTIGASLDPDLAIDRIEATWSRESLRAGRFVALRAQGMRLRARLDDGGLSLGALDPIWKGTGRSSDAPVLPAAEIALDGADLRVDTPRGPASGTLGGALHETAQGIEGKFAIDLAGAGLTARGRLSIGGSLAAPSFWLRLDPLRAGSLALALDARGRALDGGAVAIERATLRVAGGTLRVGALQLDPRAKQTAASIRVEAIDLGELLALAAVEGLTGSGRIAGELPLVRQGGQLRIEKGDLRATGAGTLRYAPSESVRSLATSRPADLGLAIEAFSDFRYDVLEARIDGDLAGALTIGLHVRGANPSFENGRVVELNLNLESRLADLVRSGAASYRVPERIEERIKNGARPGP